MDTLHLYRLLTQGWNKISNNTALVSTFLAKCSVVSFQYIYPFWFHLEEEQCSHIAAALGPLRLRPTELQPKCGQNISGCTTQLVKSIMGVKSTKTVLVVCCMFMMEASGVQTPSSTNGESLEVRHGCDVWQPIHHFKMENEDILVSHWLSTTWNLDFSHYWILLIVCDRYNPEVRLRGPLSRWQDKVEVLGWWSVETSWHCCHLRTKSKQCFSRERKGRENSAS